jgi:hypothetical protein
VELITVGALIYFGFCFAGIVAFHWKHVAAIVLVAGGIAVLLSMDEQADDDKQNLAEMTFAGFIYLMLARRRAAITLGMFVIATSVAGAYYLVLSLFKFEHQGTAGTLVVKLPGETVYYHPLHPYGWENTHIRLKKDQRYEVEITGQVSPGLLQEADKINGYIRAWQNARGTPPENRPQIPDGPTWKFTGPEGYPDSFYAKPYSPHYTQDDLLTVRGMRHNAVIGIVVADGEPPCHKNPVLPTPCEVSKESSAQYDATADGGRLYLLSSPRYPIPLDARHTGVLWLNINDAGGLRFDNIGLFFVKISTRSRDD